PHALRLKGPTSVLSVPNAPSRRETSTDVNHVRETPAWRYDLDLTDPRQAYAAGCIDGYLRRCAEEDAENDWMHRETVKRIRRVIDQVDARRKADRGESSEGQRAA
ncbi:MAG: hypothetical protein JWR34_2165, partial [Mycobacterium sp.]|nr:hypothetical protein [Mycobacterium sp.]